MPRQALESQDHACSQKRCVWYGKGTRAFFAFSFIHLPMGGAAPRRTPSLDKWSNRSTAAGPAYPSLKKRHPKLKTGDVLSEKDNEGETGLEIVVLIPWWPPHGHQEDDAVFGVTWPWPPCHAMSRHVTQTHQVHHFCWNCPKNRAAAKVCAKCPHGVPITQKWPIYVSWPWLFNYSQFILELSKVSNSHPSSSKLCMQAIFIEHCMYHYSTVIINQLEIPIECVRQITRYTKSFKTHSSRLACGSTSGIYSCLCLTCLHASLVITLRRSLRCRLCTIHPSVSHCMYDTHYAK